MHHALRSTGLPLDWKSEAGAAADPASGARAADAGEETDAQPTPEPVPVDQPQGEPQGQHACVVKEQIATVTVPVAVFDDQVMMQTEVDIEWQPPASKLEPIHAITYCDCACGEYRQFVRGHMIRNGVKIDLPLPWGAKLDETAWHEDGDPSTDFIPGHRDRKQTTNDVFDRPNREWGCHYHGKDEPRLPGKAGDMVDVDLKFKGQTYDKCLDKFGPIHEWAFTYKGPLTGV